VTTTITAQRQMWAFHSFLSHKLRTPLTSVLVGAGILQRRVNSLPDDLAMLVDTTYTGAQRLKAIIDAVFRYLEAPVTVGHGTGIACTAIPALAQRLAGELDISTLSITTTFMAQALHLPIDTTTLELILTELFVNARKFHPQQQPALLLELHCTTEHARLCVSDNGLTLSSADLQQIAQPYHQIDHEFTGQIPGVGLGLATVARICWAAGGTWRIVNRSDMPGVQVLLELPVTPTADAP
jgi:signal transduction histidine kinase